MFVCAFLIAGSKIFRTGDRTCRNKIFFLKNLICDAKAALIVEQGLIRITDIQRDLCL